MMCSVLGVGLKRHEGSVGVRVFEQCHRGMVQPDYWKTAGTDTRWPHNEGMHSASLMDGSVIDQVRVFHNELRPLSRPTASFAQWFLF